MANRVLVEINAKTSGYKNAIDEAKDANKQFSSSIPEMKIEGLTRDMRRAQREASDLAIAVSKLSKGQLGTAEGKALARQFIDAKKRAAELYDVVMDTREEIKNMASDTSTWDAFKEGIDMARDSLSAYAAVAGDSENIEQMIAAIARVQTVANAAISIGNALQKQSAIMAKIRMVQENMLAKSIEMEAAATGKATIAQKLYNAVAKANPYVLLAIAVGTVVAAISTYIAITKKANAEDKSRARILESLKEAQETYNSTFTQSASESLASYKRLQAQWRTLKSDHEKNAWIKNNAKEFEKLNLKVDNIVDAEKTFVSNSGSVIQGLMQRAKGAATAAQAQELYAKALERTTQLEALKQEYAEKMANAKDKTIYVQTSTVGTAPTAINVSAEEQRAQLMQELTEKMADLKLEQQEIINEADDLIRKSVDLLGIETQTTKAKENTTKETKKQLDYTKNSLAALEAALSELQNRRKNGLLDNIDASIYLKQVDELKKAIEAKKIELGIELPLNALQDIQKRINDLKANQLNVNTRLSAEQFRAELKKLEKEEHEINVNLGFEVELPAIDKLKNDIEEQLSTENIEFNASYDLRPSELKKKQRELEQYTWIEENVALSESDLNEIRTKIAQLKDEIEAEEIILHPRTIIEEKQANIDDLQEKASSIYQANGGMPEPDTEAYKELLGIFKQIHDIQKEIAEMQDPINAAEEKQNKIIDKRAQAFEGIGNAISGIGSAMADLGDKEDKGIQVAALIAQAIGSVLAGAGSAIGQAGKTGNPWAWLAFAVTTMATAAATIAQIKNLSAGNYAYGGIVPGNSYYGDKMIAHVNSGEGIFTTSQQKRLFDIANGKVQSPSGGSIVIESVGVRGEDIILAARNTLKINGETL